MKTSLIIIGLCIFIIQGCAQPSKVSSDKENRPSTDITHSLELNPIYEKDYRIAQELLSKNSFTKAIPLLSKITTANPGYTDAWANYALALYKSNDYIAADTAIKKALLLNTTSAELLDLDGLIQIGLGHYKSAENSYLKALQIKSNCVTCHYNLALLYDVYYQDLKRAIIHYQSYLNNISVTDDEIENWIDELQRNIDRNAS
jgi:tetratricopeptide (TPR) repeat protein